MSQTDQERLQDAIRRHWPYPPGEKAQRYVGQFFDATRFGNKIAAQVEGNHGTYTVSVQATESGLTSACSCYIGKYGDCHHCHALALTFLQQPGQFVELKSRPLEEVTALADLPEYLRGVTLDELLAALKAQGITQKAFAEAMGMNPRHLTAVKSSELRNRTYNELGAIKLACLWALDRFKRA